MAETDRYEVVRVLTGLINYRDRHVVSDHGDPDPPYRNVVKRDQMGTVARALFERVAKWDGVYTGEGQVAAARTEVYRVDKNGRRLQLNWRKQ